MVARWAGKIVVDDKTETDIILAAVILEKVTRWHRTLAQIPVF